jgi:hypothetical protein
MKRLILFALMAILGLMIAGCNLPSTEPVGGPTANATLTAIFAEQTATSTKPIILVSATPAPPTNTPEPSNTPEPTLTFTPTNTNTPVPPTITPTPHERKGTTINAAFIATPPVIDGNWDDWKTTQFPLRNIVWGAANWVDNSDLECSFRIGWDYKYLYLAVKVNDDKYVQNATGDLLYKGDGIEILLDADLLGDFKSTSVSSDDYQLGISPGKGGIGTNLEAYLWLPDSKKGNKTVDIKMASIAFQGGYRIEARIPWSLFGITADRDMEFGFAISVNDNDKETENVQQTMMSNVKTRDWSDPTTWGNLILVK